MERARIVASFFIAWLVLSEALGFCDEEAIAARRVFEEWKDAVVTIRLVTEQRMMVSGRQIHKGEEKIETMATVIEPYGLAVLSLFSTDPTAFLEDLVGGRFGGEDALRFDLDSEIVDVKMVFGDGREVEAEIILRDKDLDLAFVRPLKRPKDPIPAVDLSMASTPEIMDRVLILGRLGRVADRAPYILPSRIQAIIENPRRLYVPILGGLQDGVGAPVFTLDGRVVGILLVRTSRSQMGGTGLISGLGICGGMADMDIIPVILPATDIQEVARQIPKEE